MGSSTPSVPKAPNVTKSYDQGAQAYLQYLPTFLQGEQAARNLYNPQRVAGQQQLQSTYGPTQYGQQLQALNQLDPGWMALRNQLGNQVYSDLQSGYSLPPAYQTQLQNQIRGAQTARGNALGNSATADESGFLGQAALQLYQQKIQNAGNFLQGTTVPQQLLAVQPVQADMTSQYVNPNAGFQGQQFALNNYQNLLAQQAASGAGRNPWSSALSGAASGASSGAMVGGGYGAIAGGLIGGVGGYFSDARMKENVEHLGGLLYKFNYKLDKTRKFIGTMADAVSDRFKRKGDGFLSDFWIVDYEGLGLRLQEVL